MKLLKGLLSTGHEIHIASGTYPVGSGMEWNSEGFAAMEAAGVKSVHVHRSMLDDMIGLALRKRDERTGRVRPLDSWAYAPPLLRKWFGRLAARIRPDILVVNYASSDTLVEASGFDRSRCILDLPDLVLVNKAMRRFLSRNLPPGPLDPATAPDRILDLECFAGMEAGAGSEEVDICARYGRVLSVSRREADLVDARGGSAVHLPVSMAPVPLDNSWSGRAILATGPNSFNAQGYLWFAAKVLPLVRAKVPEFELGITGALCPSLSPLDGVVPMGFVENISDIYRDARFSICPVFGGTGQQVKIVESMAHGVPVVALSGPARESPIRHGINGSICGNEEAFAEACVGLWNDAELRRSRGLAARAAVSEEASDTRYRGEVARIVEDVLGAGR
ncbi:MAG TPA: glycosyltransferase family 4 protein [Fibrobacteria bacterium]|nr:glycosyltransferase family 4 protein [Fibrobacteria bacterium]